MELSKENVFALVKEREEAFRRCFPEQPFTRPCRDMPSEEHHLYWDHCLDPEGESSSSNKFVCLKYGVKGLYRNSSQLTDKHIVKLHEAPNEPYISNSPSDNYGLSKDYVAEKDIAYVMSVVESARLAERNDANKCMNLARKRRTPFNKRMIKTELRRLLTMWNREIYLFNNRLSRFHLVAMLPFVRDVRIPSRQKNETIFLDGNVARSQTALQVVLPVWSAPASPVLVVLLQYVLLTDCFMILCVKTNPNGAADTEVIVVAGRYRLGAVEEC